MAKPPPLAPADAFIAKICAIYQAASAPYKRPKILRAWQHGGELAMYRHAIQQWLADHPVGGR
jgi:hypothetical protein